MGHGSYKASKGLIRVDVQVHNNKVSEIQISGDFFMYPEDYLWKLEEVLIGTPAIRDKILAKIQKFYKKTSLLTPGVTSEDFTEAILRAIKNVSS